MVIEEDAAEAALAAEMGLEAAEDTATSTVLDSQEQTGCGSLPPKRFPPLSV